MHTTKGPMWGHPMLVLGALCSFLEPFHGHLSPNIDNVSEKLTSRYPHEGPWVATERLRPAGGSETLFSNETSVSRNYAHRCLHSSERVCGLRLPPPPPSLLLSRLELCFCVLGDIAEQPAPAPHLARPEGRVALPHSVMMRPKTVTSHRARQSYDDGPDSVLMTKRVCGAVLNLTTSASQK